jgi:transcriptional regulator NrdR family protein
VSHNQPSGFPHLLSIFPLVFLLAVCQYIAMVCIYCSGDTMVINSRLQKRVNTVWRRRRCKICGATVTTEEAPRYETALMVQSSTDALQPFSRDILFVSLYKSLAHRKTATTDAADLTKTLIASLHNSNQATAIIDKYALTAHVTACLERFDTAAASHYRAYHPVR